MRLPKLPELPDFDIDDNEPKSPNQAENKRKEKPKKGTKKEKNSIIPKTQYDAEGNPILAIPDLDDVDLNSEIDRFFGKGR